MICRLLKHAPLTMVNEKTGEDVVRCTRCGQLEDEWDDPLIGRKTRATLLSCIGVGIPVYTGADAFATSPAKAALLAVLAVAGAVCTKFGTDALDAG